MPIPEHAPPPRTLDGAQVLLWAASRTGGFHTIPAGADPSEPGVVVVAGMAICRFADASDRGTTLGRT